MKKIILFVLLLWFFLNFSSAMNCWINSQGNKYCSYWEDCYEYWNKDWSHYYECNWRENYDAPENIKNTTSNEYTENSIDESYGSKNSSIVCAENSHPSIYFSNHCECDQGYIPNINGVCESVCFGDEEYRIGWDWKRYCFEKEKDNYISLRILLWIIILPIFVYIFQNKK